MASFARDFVERLSTLRFQDVFNPYADICPSYDIVGAPAIRRHNLRRVLDAASAGGIESIWVGLELGRGGGRRTGLPMTDDLRLDEHGRLFGIPDLARATHAGPESEITSAAVWEAIGMIRRRVFLWNVFPLHSHKAGLPISNRRHTAIERNGTAHLFEQLISALEPSSIVAIGGEAKAALALRGYEFTAVRHPAYGGKTKFLASIRQHYGTAGN